MYFFFSSSAKKWVQPIPSGLTPSAAFSVRRLLASYNGPLLRVRRSSDNAETDIGYNSSGNLLTDNILSFVGVGSGFVTTMYDQSGNGRNATQATAALQPRIVNAGVVDTRNSRPAVQFGASGVSGFVFPVGVATPSAWTVSAVLNTDSSVVGAGGLQVLLDGTDAARFNFGILNASSVGPVIQSVGAGASVVGSLAGSTATRIYAGILNGAGSEVFVNGTSYGTGTVPLSVISANLVLGTRFSFDLYWLVGTVSECVLFQSALSTFDRQNLGRNQGRFYGITVV